MKDPAKPDKPHNAFTFLLRSITRKMEQKRCVRAFRTMRSGLQLDYEWATTWHDNIACFIKDSIPHVTMMEANEAAARIMKNCFDVEITDEFRRRKP